MGGLKDEGEAMRGAVLGGRPVGRRFPSAVSNLIAAALSNELTKRWTIPPPCGGELKDSGNGATSEEFP